MWITQDGNSVNFCCKEEAHRAAGRSANGPRDSLGGLHPLPGDCEKGRLPTYSTKEISSHSPETLHSMTSFRTVHFHFTRSGWDGPVWSTKKSRERGRGRETLRKPELGSLHFLLAQDKTGIQPTWVNYKKLDKILCLRYSIKHNFSPTKRRNVGFS